MTGAAAQIIETAQMVATGGDSPTLTPTPRVIIIDASPEISSNGIGIDDLYEESAGVRFVLHRALRGLALGLKAVSESLEALKRGEPVAADDALLRLQVLLPELFCCREIGDSFGAIINALKFSFENAKGQPFTQAQVEAVHRALSQLRNEPFLPFDTASERIAELEDAGLNVDPPALAALGDLLDVESLR